METNFLKKISHKKWKFCERIFKVKKSPMSRDFSETTKISYVFTLNEWCPGLPWWIEINLFWKIFWPIAPEWDSFGRLLIIFNMRFFLPISNHAHVKLRFLSLLTVVARDLDGMSVNVLWRKWKKLNIHENLMQNDRKFASKLIRFCDSLWCDPDNSFELQAVWDVLFPDLTRSGSPPKQ